jgi:choline dehydrogenase-like flavoprotein
MRKAVVVGSGAGGAAVAKELQGFFDVIVLEAGKEFRRFRTDLRKIERLKKAGLLFNEKWIEALFPAMRIRKGSGGMVLVSGRGTGGTTPLATANALRLDRDLKDLGIDLDPEFNELENEIPVTTAHQEFWNENTRRLFDAFAALGLRPDLMPKMGRFENCAACGKCTLGCPNGVKWDSRQFLVSAARKGATVRTGITATKVRIRGGAALGVEARTGTRRLFFPADAVVLAAGGFGTPPLLERSGIAAEARFFVDPVLCVAARLKHSHQNRDIPMPFFARKEGYILSPYFDYLSYFFNRDWRPPAGGILSLMIKLADDDRGFSRTRKVEKILSGKDREKLKEAADICAEILGSLGIRKEDLFFGTLNAGHPGGGLPLDRLSASSFHDPRLPENLYVADASLLPRSLGAPPTLTIMALAKRIARLVIRKFADG